MNKSTQRVLTSAKVQQTIFCSGHLPKIWLMTDIQLREKEQKLNKKNLTAGIITLIKLTAVQIYLQW